MKPLARASSAAALLLAATPLHHARLLAQAHPTPLVRLAELEIDPAQLEAYKTALREEIETSVRVEPGVLTLYAVTLKDQPSHIRLFEQYASPPAYQAHLQSPHFLRYKAATSTMVRSLKLLEADPLVLATKPSASAAF